jgi:hypothetical protein
MTVVLYSEIGAYISEKQAGRKMDIVGEFPLLPSLSGRVFVGSFSWYYVQQRRKEILRRFALRFPFGICTPSELARSYIACKYPRQRALNVQTEIFKRHITAPLYVQPHHYDSGFYVDIKSAYWQILQVVGWDADYYPGVWLAKGQPMDDFPFAQNRLARNCLVTCGLPSEASVWDGDVQKFIRVKTFNKQINLGIWKLVLDVLHCIAWDCIAAGAIYAHTDGYICSSERVVAVQNAISEWGLESTIKRQGVTDVYGVGSYTIDKFGTKNQHIKTRPYDGLNLPEYNNWLKKRFQAHSQRTQFLWKDLRWEKSPSEQSSLSLPNERFYQPSISAKEASEMHASKIDSNGVIQDELSSSI